MEKRKNEKLCKLSKASLITWILSLFFIVFGYFLLLVIFIIPSSEEINGVFEVMILLFSVFSPVYALAIASILCGIIDLRKIKLHLISRRRKIVDLIGIVLGSIIVIGLSSGTIFFSGSMVSSKYPDWSPDGNKIVFISNDLDGNTDIYVMNVDGSDKINLTNNPEEEHSATWSPDGNKIVFISNDLDGNNDIHVMNADGSGKVNLTNSYAQFEYRPAWSPDGSKIVFISNDGHLLDDIYIMNADGSEKIRLTDEKQSYNYPIWSPDGKKIAFILEDLNSSYSDLDIYIMNADGSEKTNLTNSPEREDKPIWSPDGKKIAYGSCEPIDYRGGSSTEPMDIYVMNADGSGKVNLTNSPEREDKPIWSPDGKKIAFVLWDRNWEIFVMNNDGSEKINLARGYSPSWSPDSKKIVFFDGGHIYSINTDGSEIRRLTKKFQFK